MPAVIDIITLEKLLIIHGGSSIAWDARLQCWVIDNGVMLHAKTFERLDNADLRDRRSEAEQSQGSVE